MLAKIRIRNVDELRAVGAVRAYVALKRAGVAGSMNMLWALAGALDPWPEGRHWREVARGESRLSLLLEVEDTEGRSVNRAL
jgi:DNA transformation protein and related proteins